MKRKSQEVLLSYFLLLPILLVLLLIILLPSIWAFRLSFFDYRLGQLDPPQYVGLKNYLTVARDVEFLLAFIRTIVFMVTSVALQLVSGFLLALLMAKPFPLKGLWISLILSPMAVSPAVLAVIWKYLLDFNIGPINYLLQVIGPARLMWLTDKHLAMITVILVYSWGSMPGVFLLLYPVRLSIPDELYEAVEIDGASGWQSTFNVTLPMMKPVLLVALVFRTIISFRTFDIFQTLTQGGPNKATEVISLYLFNQTFRYWKYGAGTAVAFFMLLVTMILASAQIKKMHENLFLKKILQ